MFFVQKDNANAFFDAVHIFVQNTKIHGKSKDFLMNFSIL